MRLNKFGHPCSFSSNIAGSITAGTGKLDEMGDWEFPCQYCVDKFHQSQKDSIIQALKPYGDVTIGHYYCVDGPGNWIVDFYTPGDSYIACLTSNCKVVWVHSAAASIHDTPAPSWRGFIKEETAA